ncbi:MAG: MucR family transcriptional regulator [Terriglobales bacterium]
MAYSNPAKRAAWYVRNAESLRAYKADWARRHAAEARAYYRDNRTKAVERAKANYRARLPKLAPQELLRLRRPENLLEALEYGTDRQCVCLGCGGLFANLARHCAACPVEPISAADYRARWGYMKSNPLASPAEQARKRKAMASPRAREARAARSASSAVILAAGRAGQKGRPRGPRRAEQHLRHKGERRAARPHLQKVPDPEVLKIMAQNLTIAESAKRLGLSQYAYWRRVQRLDSAHFGRVRQQRQAVNRYVFDLRAWLWEQAAVPTLGQVLNRHAAQMRQRSATAAAFNPFLHAFEVEVRADPEALERLAAKEPARTNSGRIRLLTGSAAITLASRIFRRARATAAAPGPAPKRKGGRPRDENLWRRAQEFSAAGLSKRKIAPLLYPGHDTEAAYAKTKMLFRRRGVNKPQTGFVTG